MSLDWPRSAIVGLMIAGLGFLVFALHNCASPAEPEAIPAEHAHLTLPSDILESLREGDIIFRGKDFSWGDLGALASDKDQRFGHVGVIVQNPEGWAVIDAIGNPLDVEGSVRLRTFEEFLSPATRMAIYRPLLAASQREAFIAEIWRHKAASTPFDRFYDLEDQSALYCTELIWLALKTATGTEQIAEQTLFRDRRVIAIDDLQYAPLMSEIWTYDPAS